MSLLLRHSRRSLLRSIPSSGSFTIKRNLHIFQKPQHPKLFEHHSPLGIMKHHFSSYPEHEIIGLPALSPSVESSTIIEWKKKEGDFIEADHTIATVQTDKAELDWKVVDDVYLAKILLKPGEQVPIGTPCAIFVENEKDVSAFKDYNNTSKEKSSSTESSPPSPPNLPDHKVEGMPALSPTATDGAVVSWSVKEGDFIEEGSVIAEIQTDKSVVTWNSTDDGYIAKLLVTANPDQKYDVGTPIAIIVDDKNSISAFENYNTTETISGTEEPKPIKTTRTPSIKFKHGVKETQQGRKSASPLARRLAREKGIDLTNIDNGSGGRGRITTNDLDKAKTVETKKTVEKKIVPKGDRSYEDIKISSMRNIIGKRLVESMLTSPHFYTTMECNIDKLLSMRKDINENESIKISVNDFIVKACGLALRDVPEVNQSWMEGFIRKYYYYDISVAVATPTGLITPIVKDVNNKGLKDISLEIKDLAKRAKENKLRLDEFQGGTFTISNMGMYGINHFTAIINPPQSCILAVSAGRQELKPDSVNGFKVVNVMNVCLSSDHRSVDGAVAAQWLNSFKNYIEYPAKLLL